ncbi:hypothetical protein WJX73_001928 [Symbiochloris irregularis]|uniref:Methyltransferase domain-containing protein n=1 Tax=Symbiochloris irregularis TaxID=706552 RepID=A0AAW1NSQ0_9CHLO
MAKVQCHCNQLTRPARRRQVCAHASALQQLSSPSPQLLGVVVALAALAIAVKRVLDRPSRTYDADDPNVGRAYDDWTREGILEYYWGDHIHLGYYTDAERAAGYKRKDFKQAKRDFVDEMLRFSSAQRPKRILDVGCGVGGTSRILAAKFSEASVTGITLSPEQAARATNLAKEQGINNCTFKVVDALNMTFEEESFDLVWACESGEHMPDKEKYVKEMLRMLAPGGHIAIATWCQRDLQPGQQFTEKEKGQLQFLYDEWAHPFFISKEEYGRILEASGKAQQVHLEDWTPQTVPTWRHSNWVGVWDPWIVVFKGPIIWYKTIREIIMIERMHRAFSQGLMEYGMIRAQKPQGQSSSDRSEAGKQTPQYA